MEIKLIDLPEKKTLICIKCKCGEECQYLIEINE